MRMIIRGEMSAVESDDMIRLSLAAKYKVSRLLHGKRLKLRQRKFFRLPEGMIIGQCQRHEEFQCPIRRAR
ncbi:hypothetical protein D3C81_2113020 [compost metagenome]